jgi:predicted nucleotidyltransferase
VGDGAWCIKTTVIRFNSSKRDTLRRTIYFGSRVQGTAKPFSDLDLAVMGDVPLDFRQLADLKDAFAESDLPWLIGRPPVRRFGGLLRGG